MFDYLPFIAGSGLLGAAAGQLMTTRDDLDQSEKHASAAATTLAYFSSGATAFEQSEKRISTESTAHLAAIPGAPARHRA
jgi:hypothetical protein